MNTSLITPQTVELISLLTRQKLRKEDITPPVLFLAGLVTVLLGVIHADGTVSAEETQRLLTTFTELIPPNSSLGPLVMPMVKGVREQQVYNKLQELLALTACFSEEEKLLLISFGYQMSAADGTIEEPEKEYLTIADYANQFVKKLTQEIDDWSAQKLQFILKQKIAILDSKINEEISAIRQDFQQLDLQLSTSLVTQFNNFAARNLGGIGTDGLDIASSINSDIGGPGGFLGGLGLGGAVAAALLAFAGVGIIPAILAALAAASGGTFGLGMLDIDGIHPQIKQKVCELGLQKFKESEKSILEKIKERIKAVCDERNEAASGAIAQAMLLWENLLEQQENRDRQNQAGCEAQKVWLADKRRELEQVQNQIQTILNQSAR